MTFEQALQALKDGKKVAREDWDGVFWLEIGSHGTIIQREKCGSLIGTTAYVAYSDDLLANDWYILGEEEKPKTYGKSPVETVNQIAEDMLVEKLNELRETVMKIPTSVKVGNYVYAVDLTCDELFLNNLRCFGTVDYNNHIIRINKAVQDDQGLFNTFLHELIHAIFHQRSVVLDPESEESIVEELARGLHGVLVDNDGLFEFDEGEGK